MIDANVMPSRFHVMAKPTGSICNLDCKYCFFLAKEALYPDSDFRMNERVLERYIRQLIEAHRGDTVTIAWQGGEPTIMGVRFFRQAMAIAEKYRRPGMVFEHTMQTNGTLLDEAFCEFLAEHRFLVGISVDGPRELHDVYRVDKGGAPTFDNVMRGLRLLQKHRVDFNVLTTVNRVNADHPLKVYRFHRDEIGTDWIQFIPVVERINADGQTLLQQGDTVTDRSVRPEQYGRFLSAVFDEWVRHDVGKVYVQTFEAAVRNWMGAASSGLCVFNEKCGSNLALEHNGDVFSCDHFVEPEYLIGNLANDDFATLLASDRQQKFGRDKAEALPKYCRDCEVRFACHGECPKNRFASTPAGEPGLNYLCEGYKAFFRHIDRPVSIMAALIRSRRPARDVMRIVNEEDARLAALCAKAGRNDPCPCGSGAKVKRCHGARPEDRDVVVRTHKAAERRAIAQPVAAPVDGRDRVISRDMLLRKQ